MKTGNKTNLFKNFYKQNHTWIEKEEECDDETYIVYVNY